MQPIAVDQLVLGHGFRLQIVDKWRQFAIENGVCIALDDLRASIVMRVSIVSKCQCSAVRAFALTIRYM